MADKILIRGQSLVIEDSVTNDEIAADLKSKIYYDSQKLQQDSVVSLFYKKTAQGGKDSLVNSNAFYTSSLSNCVDKDGTPYTKQSFREFSHLNLGFDFAPPGATSNGFIDYNDTSTASGITLVKNVWTDIPNDGLGAFTNKASKPAHVTELMDNTTGYLDTSELNIGDTILVRNDFTITPQSNNANLEFRYELGSGQSLYFLEKTMPRLDLGSGIGYRYALTPDLIYMGDDNTRLNPIKLQVKLSVNGSLVNAGSVIQVIAK